MTNKVISIPERRSKFLTHWVNKRCRIREGFSQEGKFSTCASQTPQISLYTFNRLSYAHLQAKSSPCSSELTLTLLLLLYHWPVCLSSNLSFLDVPKMPLSWFSLGPLPLLRLSRPASPFPPLLNANNSWALSLAFHLFSYMFYLDNFIYTCGYKYQLHSPSSSSLMDIPLPSPR